jgi:hypothetical protein
VTLAFGSALTFRTQATSPYGATRYSAPFISIGLTGTWRASPLFRPVVVSTSVRPQPRLAMNDVSRLTFGLASYGLTITPS